jgi:hypothetical protein
MSTPPTPGPWQYDGKFTVTIPHAQGDTSFRTHPEDARLIALAPDLLLACKMALNDRMYKDWPEIADFLITLIKKAEGP